MTGTNMTSMHRSASINDLLPNQVGQRSEPISSLDICLATMIINRSLTYLLDPETCPKHLLGQLSSEGWSSLESGSPSPSECPVLPWKQGLEREREREEFLWQFLSSHIFPPMISWVGGVIGKWHVHDKTLPSELAAKYTNEFLGPTHQEGTRHEVAKQTLMSTRRSRSCESSRYLRFACKTLGSLGPEGPETALQLEGARERESERARERERVWEYQRVSESIRERVYMREKGRDLNGMWEITCICMAQAQVHCWLALAELDLDSDSSRDANTKIAGQPLLKLTLSIASKGRDVMIPSGQTFVQAKECIGGRLSGGAIHYIAGGIVAVNKKAVRMFL